MREPKMWHLDLPRRLLVLSCATTYFLLSWLVFDVATGRGTTYAGIAAMLVLAMLPTVRYSRMVLCVVAVLFLGMFFAG